MDTFEIKVGGITVGEGVRFSDGRVVVASELVVQVFEEMSLVEQAYGVLGGSIVFDKQDSEEDINDKYERIEDGFKPFSSKLEYIVDRVSKGRADWR